MAFANPREPGKQVEPTPPSLERRSQIREDRGGLARSL